MKVPILTLGFALLALAAQAENWAQWRGPAFNGSSPETGLPQGWSATEGIAWKAPMPGPSGATPAIWGDSIFVSSPDENRNLTLLCLDRKDGKVRWQKVVVEGGDISNRRNNMAAPSPVTDGKAVYVLYGTGHLAAFDFAGQELWKRSLGEDYGKFAIQWAYGSSPMLFDGRLYVQVLQRASDRAGSDGASGERESYLLALDPATGKTLWKHVRSTEARAESMESYGTPIPHIGDDGKAQLLVIGGDCLTGHDPATGTELWRGYGFNRRRGEAMRIVATPLSAAGVAIGCGPKQEPVLAFRTDLRGDITESGLAWTFDERQTPDVCTPAFYDGKLFVLNGDKQTLTCLDPKTGQKKWQGQLPDRTVIRSSPTAADGKIYVINEMGTVFVCGTGDEFQVLATIPLGGGEGTRASIAVSEKQLFFRTPQELVCVGK